ncbi:sensor histidine kinase [Planomonospora parontospora]|uniref:sensor histidine kinase n=1 Tax=Planomonospora parontospora TaxID=58119 RepID=UPI00166FA773|nr:HAMP domain-containing sensor histidine kinase [Planomonospora parontospora]GGL42794.1 two-component sensor histidine kinase [Planomonospora parontospora subsp. antibiotica]GII18345.1 two-component sensor histidine kinase [Planomonospora parontospora subsp. antibiotica]
MSGSTGSDQTGTSASANPRRGGRRLGGLSLRGRLLLITSVLLAAGLLVSGTVAIATLRAHLVGRVDEQLRPLSALLARLPAALVRRPLPGEGGGDLRPLPGVGLVDRVHVAYLAPDGTVLHRENLSARGPDGGPRLPPLDAGAVARRAGRPFDAPGHAGGANWRVIAVPWTGVQPSSERPSAERPSSERPSAERPSSERPPPSESGAVVVAASLNGVRSTITRLGLVCLVTAVVLLTLLTVAGWFAVRGGLRPLREIEETAAAIAGGDLSRRVPGTAAPGTEIGRLSAALNGMLGQLETAFAEREASEARMRRFVADASHELRTPLFGIKGFSELHRMGGLSDTDRAMSRIESEASRLARLIEDLLLLARLDEGESALPMDLAPMDLRTLAADARHDLHALDPTRPVTLTGPDNGPPAEAPVHGDEARLRQVTSNLVGNAVAHTPPGTPVRIGVGTAGDEAVLVIEDTGPGMTAEQATRVFDRFHRADGSRSRAAGGGAGLGLAIVRSIVTAHGGRVEVRTAPGRGAAFRVLLPLAGPGPAEPPQTG